MTTAVATREPAVEVTPRVVPAPPRPTRPAPAPARQWDLGAVAVSAPPAGAAEDNWIPESVLNLVRAIPGYALASAALRRDLLTGVPVTMDLGTTLETLLSRAGPFGAGVGTVLHTLNVLSSVMAKVTAAFVRHDVTFSRISRDISAVWSRKGVLLGMDENVAIVRGYVDAFLADVSRAINELVAELLQVVREAVVPVVEPLLADPAIAPIWNLAVKVMHYNPLTGREVLTPTVEILADFLTLIGKGQAVEQMRERGTLQQTADWLDAQFETFAGLVGQAVALFNDAWNAISPANLPNLLNTLPGLAQRAIVLFHGVKDFATTVATKVLELIKDCLLALLSEKAREVPGFRLLTVILGKDPFTKARVERTAEALIGGFIELLPNGRETYQKLSEAGVIANAAARIEGEMARLNITWDLITGTFRAIWNEMTLEDLLSPLDAIQRVIQRFGEPLGRITSFIATVIQVVIELVLKLMNFPTELLAGIIDGVAAAVDDIKRDPIAFLNNLLAALKAGFQRFFDNILVHLMGGLAGWLFRGLRGLGIQPPAELSGAAVLKLVLDVLGLSVEFLWQRLAVAVGQERVDQIRGAVGALGEAWAFIGDVQERGLVTLWEYISGQLGMLWDTILSAAQDWLMTRLINAAIAKVLSMLDPSGVMAVVNSFIAFFRAVQSVLDYFTELLQIVKTYVDTLAAVARGDITPGAAMLERGLANAIPVAIGFLANQVGLGNIPEKIVEIIGRLREMITKAIDWLIQEALRLGAAALRVLGVRDSTGGTPAESTQGGDVQATEDVTLDGHRHEVFVRVHDGRLVIEMASVNRQRLRNRIYTALKSPGVSANSQLTERLNDLDDEVKKQEGRIDSAQWLGRDIHRKVEALCDEEAVKVVRKLQRIGRDFTEVAFLKEDPWAFGGAVLNHVDIRRHLYAKKGKNVSLGEGLLDDKKTFRNQRLKEARDKKINEEELWKIRDPEGFKKLMSYVCPGDHYDTPHLADHSNPREKMELDHFEPVWENWNSKGRHTNQQFRISWYREESNLRGMCSRHNKAKINSEQAAGQGKYHREVGPNFKGPSWDPPQLKK